ncbi:MAG: aminotransferase class I/II-fold pyridoxal phosphate-dependent enzyme [Candidatus Gastranaerophilales bacterium]|nr:aminotransferase class I/II-fold pyridoxal phosphate-dependent enzyme [Candidatus Gastranaerophilales bacterium]
MEIISAVKKLKKSRRAFFATPAHAQGTVFPRVLKNLLKDGVYRSDFSEVDGLDDIRKPQGCILKSLEQAAKIYNSKKTFYLFNGSTSGILALMLSTLSKDDKVLVARNCHISVYNGLTLTGAKPVWIMPQYNKEFGVFSDINIEDIKFAAEKNPDAKVLIITSPTYEGICSDIKSISEYCKSKNIIFIVDEAHGALFNFSKQLPTPAILQGADASVQSLHKNAPALNQCALLHLSETALISEKILQKNLNIINSTSPSFILLASIEASINWLHSAKGSYEIEKLLKFIADFKKKLPNIIFLENNDPSKLFFRVGGYSGEELSAYLDSFNIEDELYSAKGVLCLCGIGTSAKKLQKLKSALQKIPLKTSKNFMEYTPKLPKQLLTPYETMDYKHKKVSPKEAVGKISAEVLVPYPPGIPVLLEGEVVEERHLQFLNQENGINIVDKEDL